MVFKENIQDSEVMLEIRANTEGIKENQPMNWVPGKASRTGGLFQGGDNQ